MQPQTATSVSTPPSAASQLELVSVSRKAVFLVFGFSLILVGNNKIMMAHLILTQASWMQS